MTAQSLHTFYTWFYMKNGECFVVSIASNELKILLKICFISIMLHHGIYIKQMYCYLICKERKHLVPQNLTRAQRFQKSPAVCITRYVWQRWWQTSTSTEQECLFQRIPCFTWWHHIVCTMDGTAQVSRQVQKNTMNTFLWNMSDHFSILPTTAGD